MISDLTNVDNTTDLNKPVSTATTSAIAAAVSGKANTIHSHAATDVTQTSSYRFVTDTEKSTWNGKAAGTHTHAATDITQDVTHRFVTDAQIATWDDDEVGEGGGGGSATVSYTSTAYSSSVNLNFGSSGTNIDLTGVTGNFTVTGSNVTSGSERAILIHKTTASPITISIDVATLPAPSMQSLTTLIEAAEGAPPTFTVNAPINSVIRLFILIQGSTGSLIPDIQISTLGLDNAITVTANYNTLFVDHTMHTATVSTAEQILAQYTIPANTMAPGSYLKIFYTHATAFSGNSGNVQCKVRIGTSGTLASNPTVDDFANSNAGAIKRFAEVNVISLTSQTIQKAYSETNHSFPESRSINFAVDNTIYFTQEKQANANDAASLGLIKIEAGGL
jgi:hypothetical protein